MRRLTASIAVAAGLGLAAIGLIPAHADGSGYSASCSTMTPGIVPVTLGVDNGSTGPAVCYGTDPEVAGGRITVLNPLTTNSVGVQCEADRGTSTVVALDCEDRVNHNDDPNHTGTSVSATYGVGPFGDDVGRTGFEGNQPNVTPEEPTDGDGVTGVFVDNFTCAWVGGPGPCPAPTDVGVAVADGDVAVTPFSGSPPCTGFNNTCLGGSVRIGQGAADTVTVTAADTTESEDIPDLGCYQVEGTC